MTHRFASVLVTLLVFGCLVSGSAKADIAQFQSRWAIAVYQMDAQKRLLELESLAQEVQDAVGNTPDQAELLAWHGIIVSTLAGEKGGLGALGLAKKAKASLERSIDLDATALQGSALTSLGVLHHKVPGWPIGFGSDKKARALLLRGLEMNPTGLDPNYFMGEFLLDQKRYGAAKKYLLAARQAPKRPGRELADVGRLGEVNSLLSKLDSRL